MRAELKKIEYGLFGLIFINIKTAIYFVVLLTSLIALVVVAGLLIGDGRALQILVYGLNADNAFRLASILLLLQLVHLVGFLLRIVTKSISSSLKNRLALTYFTRYRLMQHADSANNMKIVLIDA